MRWVKFRSNYKNLKIFGKFDKNAGPISPIPKRRHSSAKVLAKSFGHCVCSVTIAILTAPARGV